jgi:hypothetical protein
MDKMYEIIVPDEDSVKSGPAKNKVKMADVGYY